jgi:hypothetical protein
MMTVTLANPAGGPGGTHALSKIRLTKRAVWGALPIYTQPWGPLVPMSCYHSTTIFASYYVSGYETLTPQSDHVLVFREDLNTP